MALSPIIVGRGTTWRGGVTMLLLTLLATLHVNIGGQSIALTFLPVIGVCLWPRFSNPPGSILLLLLFGILLDFLTFEPLGMRSLIYLTIFAVFRPDLRLKDFRFKMAFGYWVGAIVLSLFLSYVLGWLNHSLRPQWSTLLYQGLVATCLFPLVYSIRHIFKTLARDVGQRGF